MDKENFHKPFVVGLLSKDVSMYVWNNLLLCVLCCCCGICYLFGLSLYSQVLRMPITALLLDKASELTVVAKYKFNWFR